MSVVGLEPVRAREFAEGRAGFPSVRVSEKTIIDLHAERQAKLLKFGFNFVKRLFTKVAVLKHFLFALQGEFPD